MVAEPLVHKVLSMATSSSSKKVRPAASAKGGAEAAAAGDGRVGILSFEVVDST
jgi:hypothetical protein